VLRQNTVLPAYIRYFADTSDTPLGRAALGYCKSLLRIAPVKVIGTPGGFAAMQGEWRQFDELLLTPMAGDYYVNVVCAHPQRWAYTQAIQPPTHAWSDETGDYAPVTDGKPVSGMVELYTMGVRNVLLVGKMPITKGELLTGAKYEAIVVKSISEIDIWKRHCAACGELVFARPGDHDAVRAAVIGVTP